MVARSAISPGKEGLGQVSPASEAGFLTVEVRGTSRLYRVDPPSVGPYNKPS